MKSAVKQDTDSCIVISEMNGKYGLITTGNGKHLPCMVKVGHTNPSLLAMHEPPHGSWNCASVTTPNGRVSTPYSITAGGYFTASRSRISVPPEMVRPVIVLGIEVIEPKLASAYPPWMVTLTGRLAMSDSS